MHERYGLGEPELAMGTRLLEARRTYAGTNAMWPFMNVQEMSNAMSSAMPAAEQSKGS